MATTSGLNTTFNVTASYNVTTLTPIKPEKTKYFFLQGDVKNVVIAIGSISALLGVVFNMIIIITILSQRKLRKSLFLWNGLGLCFSNLLVSTIVIPLNTNNLHIESWVHGFEICKLFIVLDCAQITLAALLLISANVNRILRLRRSMQTTAERSFLQKDLLPYATVIFPWLYILVVCVPILILGEMKNASKKYLTNEASVCFHILKPGFYYALIFTMLFVPILLLFVITAILVVYYKSSKSSWHRFRQEDDDDESDVKTIRTSLVAVLGSTSGFLLAWLPFTILIAYLNLCSKRICFPSVEVTTLMYQWACASCVFTPLPWLLHSGIRDRFQELLELSREKIVATSMKMRRPMSTRSTPEVASFDAKQSQLIEKEIF